MLILQLGPLKGHALGQRLACDLLNGLFGLVGAVAGRRAAIDLGAQIRVVVHDAVGATAVLDLEHGPQRHHLATGVAHLEFGDVFSATAILLVGLHDDLPGAAKAVEVIHVERAEIDLQRERHVLLADAQALGLHPIDIRFELRCGGAETGEDTCECGVLVGFGDDGIRRFGERCDTMISTVFDLHLEAADGPHAIHRWWHDAEHEGFLNL